MIQNNAKAAFTSASIHNLNAVIQGSLTSSTIESLNTRNSSNSAALYNSRLIHLLRIYGLFPRF